MRIGAGSKPVTNTSVVSHAWKDWWPLLHERTKLWVHLVEESWGSLHVCCCVVYTLFKQFSLSVRRGHCHDCRYCPSLTLLLLTTVDYYNISNNIPGLWSLSTWALSIFITHDAIPNCFHYGNKSVFKLNLTAHGLGQQKLIDCLSTFCQISYVLCLFFLSFFFTKMSYALCDIVCFFLKSFSVYI